MYDVIVVGKGMMGAATARYLSAQSDNIALVGPDEPTNWRSHRGVFASHYDQGRITRILDGQPLWGQMARDAMAAYAEIEQRSGIKFHHAVGGLRATHSAEKADEAAAVGNQYGAEFEKISAETFNSVQSAYSFPADTHIHWEKGLAGYVNPRQLVAAQIAVAKQQATTVITATVTAVTKQSDHLLVTCDNGDTLKSRKVVIAAGAYTNKLLPNAPLSMRRKAHMVLRAEVGPAEQARLADMPTLIYAAPEGSSTKSIYQLPPVRYPDGRTYIKLGGTTLWPDRIFDTWDEIVDWFHTDGDPKEADALKSMLHQVMPNLRVENENYLSKPCILTYTQHENPYIDQLDSRLFVVTGGNGGAAKSSDTMGRLGALLTLDKPWPDDYDPASFKAVSA